MGKLGISTGKGYHNKVPFAENADMAEHATTAELAENLSGLTWIDLGTNLSITFNNLICEFSSESKKTYIFKIKFKDLADNFTFIISNYGSLSSSMSAFCRLDSSSFFIWLQYQFVAKKLYICAYNLDGTRRDTSAIIEKISYAMLR